MFCINTLAKSINKMQITNENYRPNFKGAFLINYKKALPETRKCLEELIGPHKRQIWDTFSGKDKQVMYVMKNSKDYDVAHFVIKNDLNFKYYPEVSTKLQFEPDKPQDVISYIKTQHPKLIQKPYELMEYIKSIAPEKVVLNHMASECDYNKINEITPDNVVPAFEGMKIEL